MFHSKDKILSYPIVAVDLETSGGFPLENEICEIAALKFFEGQVVGKFQTLVKVTKPMSDFVIGIHGITNEMVKDAPDVKDVISSFLKFIDESILIGHHIPFDLAFLAYEIEKVRLSLPKNKIYCTSLLSQVLISESPNHKLQTLIQFLGLEGGRAHRALDDANSCMQVFDRCLQRLDDGLTLGELDQIQEKPILWSHYSYQNFLNSDVGLNIDRALREKTIIEINYKKKGVKEDNWRRVIPKAVVLSTHPSFIMAYCTKDSKDKRFYLDKIQAAKFFHG